MFIASGLRADDASMSRFEIPSQSRASLRDGLWYVLPLDDRQVAVHLTLSGRMAAYVDGEEVARGERSLRSKLELTWGKLPDRDCACIRAASFTSGPFVCTVSKNGIEIAAAMAEASSDNDAIFRMVPLAREAGNGDWLPDRTVLDPPPLDASREGAQPEETEVPSTHSTVIRLLVSMALFARGGFTLTSPLRSEAVQWWQAQRAVAWTSVEAKIVRADVVQECPNCFCAEIAYRYPHAGQLFQNTRLSFEPIDCGSRVAAENVVATYPVGSWIQVKVDPKAPRIRWCTRTSDAPSAWT